ncbi:PTS mannitol transporter subunit IICBA [Brachybacterium huguangmaarense]
MSTTAETRAGFSPRVAVQKFGTFLSNMIMPNIGAFIAWGIITALFIEASPVLPYGPLGGFGESADGTPYTGLVGPMITYLLPLLIAFTGGHMVYGHRGGVVGAIATVGVIVGAGIPMFIGAMIMGPLGGWTMKKIDAIWDGKIPAGFEMLVNNFSAGIWGFLLALAGFFGVAPLVSGFTALLQSGVDVLVSNGLLPLTSLFIEPGKVLFLNNAINHGILTPLGTAEADQTGKSILFLLEANPGPGLGLLLAYCFFGRGAARASAPGAAVIHFLGGIHEIYFPYVLMRPVLIVSTILGGMTGIFINTIFNSGLRSPAAPGSIIAVYASASTDSYMGITLSVLGATLVSFVVAAVLLRTGKKDDGDISAATAKMEDMKGKKSSVSGALVGGAAADATGHTGPIKRIVFACDAGMGSSAMGATVLRKKVRAAGFDDVEVTNKAISNLTDEWDLVVTQATLTERAQQRTGSAVHVSVDNFMNSPRYDEVVELVRERNTGGSPAAAPVTGTAAAAAPVVVTGEQAGLVGNEHTPGPVTVADESVAAPVASAPVAPAPASSGSGSGSGSDVMPASSIVLHGSAASASAAIDEAGALLVRAGAVDPAYVSAMHDREASVSTFMGNGLAIPHGTNEAKSSIRRSGMSFVRFDQPIDWNGNPVRFVVGIAGQGNEHLALLQNVAMTFSDPAQVERLERADSADEILAIFDEEK